MNIYWLIYLSALSQLLDALPHFERNLQHNVLENFQMLRSVSYCAKIENSDYFTEVIISLLESFSQYIWLKYLLKELDFW